MKKNIFNFTICNLLSIAIGIAIYNKIKATFAFSFSKCTFSFFLIFNFSLAFVMLNVVDTFAQNVAINAISTTGNNSAMLDITSTTLGVLIPRMPYADRDSIPSPAIGLLIYNTTTNKLNYYKSTGWYELSRTFQSSTTGTNNPGGGMAINEIGAAPDSSAMLDVSSTKRGVLIPRTTEGLLTPLVGLIYYDSSLNKIRYYDGFSWKTVCEKFITTTTGAGSLTSFGVAINTTGDVADPSAILDVKSDTKGLLIPRMITTERDQILPVTGLMVYNTTTNTIDFYNGIEWSKLETDAPAQPIAIMGTASLCDSASGVTYSITAITGATSYTWSVPSGASITDGQGTTSVTINFGSTSGIVSVTADNYCGSGTAQTLAVTVTIPTVAISAQTNVSCYSGSTGSTTVTGNSGISPYTYLWTDGTTTANISSLAAGTYFVTVTDANSCTATASVTITQPAAALTASISSQSNVNCGGSTGSATATGNNGTSPYTYLWTDGTTTANISSLAAGTYFVTVTDANSCTATTSVTITQPAANLSASISSQTNVSCFGGSNGSATVTASGGTTAYTYLWSNSATTATINILTSSTYTVTVTDAQS